jgi:hypothetical protein
MKCCDFWGCFYLEYEQNTSLRPLELCKSSNYFICYSTSVVEKLQPLYKLLLLGRRIHLRVPVPILSSGECRFGFFYYIE